MKAVVQISRLQAKDLPSKVFINSVIRTTADYISKKQKHRLPAEVLVRLVGPQEMQTLNHTYRKKKSPTNVLSFGFNNPDLSFLGDIIICHSVVKKEAEQQHKLLKHHYAHMIVHGFLHLLGYDHIKDPEADVMEQLEIKILKKLHIANPYEESRP